MKKTLYLHILKQKSIHEKVPKEEHLKENGNLLVDSIMGKIDDSLAIYSTYDLKTKKLALSLYERDAKTFLNGFNKNVKKLNITNIKTITCDNGHENVELAKKYSFITYVTYQYCSWQKGSIENTYRILRYFIKKGKV